MCLSDGLLELESDPYEFIYLLEEQVQAVVDVASIFGLFVVLVYRCAFRIPRRGDRQNVRAFGLVSQLALVGAGH